MSPVGRRIVIYGVAGSGKTTFARELARHLNLTRIELDAIRHDGDWDATPWDVMRERIVAAIAAAPNGWVCEGNYRKIRDIALAQSDTVIWLRLPWRTSFTRLFARTLRRVITDAPLYAPHGPRESWRRMLRPARPRARGSLFVRVRRRRAGGRRELRRERTGLQRRLQHERRWLRWFPLRSVRVRHAAIASLDHTHGDSKRSFAQC